VNELNRYTAEQRAMFSRFDQWLSSDLGQRCVEDLGRLLGVREDYFEEEELSVQLQRNGHPQTVPIDPIRHWINQGRKSVYWLLLGFQDKHRAIGLQTQKQFLKEGKDG
jgi:hypothetical protein